MSDSIASSKHDHIPRSTGAAPETGDPKERRRAMASSFLGSTVEYYDFLLYASAAGLVFPQLFFSDLDPGIATFLSFVTLLAGYISRPLGSIAFGHFGDRFGRKNVLVITLMTMGIVSVAIGLMPSYQTIGVAAPIMLVILRIVQGIAMGGEWAGATLMSMEHAKEGSKGFGASVAIAGGPMGAILSSLVLGILSRVSGDNFANPEQYFVTDWGWRVPFLLSAVIVIIGLYMRSQVKESPEFEAARKAGHVQTGIPVVKVFKDSGKEVILGSFAAMGGMFLQGLQGAFLIPYLVASTADTATPIDRSDALFVFTASSVIPIFLIPFLSWLSDRLGRRPVMIVGGFVSIIGTWGVFKLFSTGDATLALLGLAIFVIIVQPAQYGPVGAFISEKFDAEHRYTGAGMTFQFGSILGAGLAPLIANQIVEPGGSLVPLGIVITIVLIISTTAVFVSKETARRKTHQVRFQKAQTVKV